ncbi:MAG TPA: hypothetical protein VFW28_07765 [Micropepsaceae bacterium]|nr:hypothetical protein [Micropepsaceae bacterium]
MGANKRRLFLALILATAAAIPGAAQPARNAGSIPDLSGVWAHPWLPGFESLPTGPTSLVNLSRRPDGVSNVLQLVGDYSNPILKPEAAATVKKFGEMSKAHYGFHNPRNQCWPNGVPFVLSSNGLQMFQYPDHITMIYQTDHQVRHVRMNATHPAKVTPSWYGDSVGHYEGDTLVIDTVGIKAGPFAMIDWFGTPVSPALHVVERYRLLDYAQAKDGLDRAFKDNLLPLPATVDLGYRGKHLQLLFTVEDSNVFTTPWSATVTYGRPAPLASRGLGVWAENICAENPRKYGTEDDAQVPTAKTADF